MGTYASLAALRAQGAPLTFDDARCTDALEWASRTIDRLTGLFFEKRAAQTYALDGDGTPILELPAPCLTLTSIAVDGYAVDLTHVVNRNRSSSYADDYWYPRLEWKSSLLRLQRAFGPSTRAVWALGEQNVVVAGDFGFVVDSVSPTGLKVPPPAIVRACLMLAEMGLQNLASATGAQDRQGRFLQSESIGNYSYSFGGGGGGNAAMAGDAEIDAILLQYRRAPAMGTP